MIYVKKWKKYFLKFYLENFDYELMNLIKNKSIIMNDFAIIQKEIKIFYLMNQ